MLVMCNDCSEVIEIDYDEFEIGLTVCPCGSVNLEVIELDIVDELEGDELELDQSDELELDQSDELEVDD